MSDLLPPDWLDAPASDQRAARPSDGGRGRRQRMTTEQVEAAGAEFFAWLTAHERIAELRKILPATVKPEQFVDSAKVAVLKKPSLLEASLRPSLLLAVKDAAMDGLLPDGKEGALVTRWDSESSGMAVVWQPMVWGVTKLGRETGAIASIRAAIVYRGENFHIVSGDDDRIVHEVDIDIEDAAYAALNGGKDDRGNALANVDAFLAHVHAAYCIITGVDGRVTRRHMTRQRIISLRDASKAARGPWNSRFADEMILKGVILFTTKWINLDVATAEGRRFQTALLRDLRIDFDHDGEVRPGDKVPGGVGLIGHETRLDAFEVTFGDKEPARTAPEASPTPPIAPVPMAVPEPKPVSSEALPSRQALMIWKARILEQIGRLPTAGRVAEYSAKPGFHDQLAVAEQVDAPLAEDIRDALADRLGIVKQLAAEAT